MAKSIGQLFEDGYVNIALAAFKRCKQDGNQAAHDDVEYIINLLREIQQDLRKTTKIEM